MDPRPDSKSDPHDPVDVEQVVVRFVGDSGDGMQLTGTEFTKAAAVSGNDLATFPDFPAEIRAPAGSLAGVSGFQLHFAASEIHTPGDSPDVLVAMNPAALKTNIDDLLPGGTLIVNTGTFTKPNLNKAGYESDPLADEALKRFEVHAIDISKLTAAALEDTTLTTKEKGRCKNFFALGLMYWRYSRDPEQAIANIQDKFGKKPQIAEANIKAFSAGFNYGENAQVFQTTYRVKPASFEPGTYRNVTGNEAVSLGLVAAAHLTGRPLVLASYPITPASQILHYLSNYKHHNVTTFQAEDEIAGVAVAIGAAFGGAIAVTTSSGPGIALKGEGLGLAVMTEVPLVCINVQRGGPSTGLPTKTEQADLLQALYGRNGECPMPVLAAKTPSDAFDCAVWAVRTAVKYMTPVFLLADGYQANGSEPWRLPDIDKLEPIPVKFRTDPNGFQPYARNSDTLARDWAIPGTPGLAHRIGGLEKDSITGNVSGDAENHERMVKLRADKVARVASDYGPLDLCGADSGDVLLVGWGGTFGTLRQATKKMRALGNKVSHVHLRHIMPLHPELGSLLARFRSVLVPELNMGQLRMILRSEYLVDCRGLNKVQGQPFKVNEIVEAVTALL